MRASAQTRSSSTLLASHKTKSKPKNQPLNNFRGARRTGTKVLRTGEDPIVGSGPTLSKRILDWCFPTAPVIPSPTRPPSPRGGSFDGDISDNPIGRGAKQKNEEGNKLLLGPTYLRDQATIVGARELVSPSRRNASSTSHGDLENKRNSWLAIGIKRCEDDFAVQDGGLAIDQNEEERINFHTDNDGFVFVDVAGWEDECASSEAKLDSHDKASDDWLLGTSWTNDSKYVVHTVGRRSSCPMMNCESESQSDLEHDLNEAMESSLTRQPRPPKIGPFSFMRPSFPLPKPNKGIEFVVDPFVQSQTMSENAFDSKTKGLRNIQRGSVKPQSLDGDSISSLGMDSIFPSVASLRDQKSYISDSVDEVSWKHFHNSPVDDVKLSEKLLALKDNQNTYTTMEDYMEMALDEYLACSMGSEFSEPCLDHDEEMQRPTTFTNLIKNIKHNSSSTRTEASQRHESAQLSFKPKPNTTLIKRVNIGIANDSTQQIDSTETPEFRALGSSHCSDRTSSSICSSGPERKWWYDVSPSSISPGQEYTDRRDIPLPTSRLSGRLHLTGGIESPNAGLRRRERIMVTMRGGETPPFSLFDIRRPVGDPKCGKAFLDKYIDMAWYFENGPKLSTTNQSFVKNTKARIAWGELKPKAQIDQKEYAEVAQKLAAKQRCERHDLKHKKGNWGFMDRLREALGYSSRRTDGAESSVTN
jgi:hypothetical protein